LFLNNLINKRSLGDIKEQQAKKHLQAQGLTFVEQNFNCKLGEIDLIFSDPNSDILIFVEVKYRSSSKFGGAAASVTPTKQQKIKKAALFYLSQSKITPSIRFDVVAFDNEQINWIQCAFT
jgi:putative endonuclease